MNKMQTYMQEEILKRLYPWKSLEEVKQEELKFWCKLWTDYAEDQELYWFTYMWYNEHKEEHHIMFNRTTEQIGNVKDLKDKWIIGDIIWLPPTLPRVLQALRWYLYIRDDLPKVRTLYLSYADNQNREAERKILNEDMTDATLFDQSEETQKAIALLLWYKDE